MARYTPAVPIAAEVAYTRRLQRAIVAPLVQLLRDALTPAIDAYRGPHERADDGNLHDIDALIRGVRVKYLQRVDVDTVAQEAARAAADDVDRFNARQQRLALRVVGLDVYAGGKETAQLRALRDQFVQRNVALIKTIPDHHFGQIETWIKGAIRDGARHETLAGDLGDKLTLPERRAKLIARDQISKHNGALARERQQAVGLTRYRWSATLDRRTRPDHASLHDTVQRWDAPPAIGNPGEPIQCRCVAIPVMGDSDNVQPKTSTLSQAPAQVQAPAVQMLDPTTHPAVEMLATGKHPETQQALVDLRLVPQQLFDAYANAGGKVALVDGSIVNHPKLGYLNGVRPRGYSKGETWDNVGGVFSPRENTAVAGTLPHGSASLALHELGHGLSDRLGLVPGQWALDQMAAFRGAYEKTRRSGALRKMVGVHKKRTYEYLTQAGNAGPSEAFAETFAMYYKDPRHVRTTAPRLFAYFDDLHVRFGGLTKINDAAHVDAADSADRSERLRPVRVVSEDGRVIGDMWIQV